MKRIVILISFMAALALCASAQTYIDFSDMAMVKTPWPMPDNYPSGMYMNWDNFYYVTAGIWAGEGPGFQVLPTPKTVAFLGGPMCDIRIPCHASIKLIGPNVAAFTPVSIQVAAGWLPSRVVVSAYSNGKFLGHTVWNLTTDLQTLSFPNAWSDLTEITFIPEFVPTNSNYPKAGSLVIYKLAVMMH